MAVQVFRSTDSGAPAFGSAAGSLITVLNYCLVTKLGWGSTSLGTNQVAYTQPGGSNGFTLQVDDSGVSQSRYVGWESVTAFNTGVNRFPSSLQQTTAGSGGAVFGLGISDGNGFYYPRNINGANARWACYTNTNLFHLALVNWNTSSGYNQMLTFGDVNSYKAGDAYNTVCAGSATNNGQMMTWAALPVGSGGTSPLGYIYNGSGTGQGNLSGAAIARRYTQVGGSALIGAFFEPTRFGLGGGSGNNSASQNSKTYPESISGSFEMSPIWLNEPATANTANTAGVRALLPGVWCTPYASLPDLFSFTASSGPLAGRTFEVVGIQTSNNYGQLLLETSNTWGGF